jgi:hypothetical protein
LISGTGGEKATITNLWNDGGFFRKDYLIKLKADIRDYLQQWP